MVQYTYDTDTGFYYLKARYYDPETGRFISQDSTDYANPKAISGLNLYAYCGNNPVMLIDPAGTMAEMLFTGLGGFITQLVVSVWSYVGFAVASIWDKDIRKDMNDIGWNPFNSDASIVENSTKVSFYKGVPVIRVKNMGGSMSLGAIFLDETHGANELMHERGHNTQLMSMGLGNYLIQIGIPSPWKNGDDTPWELSASLLGGASLANTVTATQKKNAKTYFTLACVPLVNIYNIFWFLFYV